jgi:hypothetical protein
VSEQKPLPGGLASDVRHLVIELRALKDRAGLSLAALAHRSPYSKSSWERYLNGKAMPPQHAVACLGKLADADPARLMALWDLANTAWHGGEAREEGTPQGGRPDGRPDERRDGYQDGRHGTDRARQPAPGPASASPADPPPQQEQPAGGRFGGRPLMWPAVVVALAVAAVSAAALSGAPARNFGRPAGNDGAPATGTSSRQIDVMCFAEGCQGKDPKEAGCGDVWTSAKTRIDGVYVELRYSDACKAAWSRISWGRPGDIARVVGADGRSYERKVRYDTDTFSAMVAAPSPSAARACVVLTSGVHGCTGWGGVNHLVEAPNPPASTTPRENPPATASTSR